MKCVAAQPPSLKFIPEQDGVDLPGEFEHAPSSAVADPFTGGIEGDAVQFADRIDVEPVLAQIGVFERDMIGAVCYPSMMAGTASIEILSAQPAIDFSEKTISWRPAE
jgi:hypothetical protein